MNVYRKRIFIILLQIFAIFDDFQSLATCLALLWKIIKYDKKFQFSRKVKTGNSLFALCTIFTILLTTLWNSEQKNGLLIKLFCFSFDFDFDETTWWSCSYPCVLQFHQVSSKSDEKQKRFINSQFFCSEFQSVSRIVKIVHSANVMSW